MKKFTQWSALLVCAVLLMVSVIAPAAAEDPVLATVNGIDITLSEADRYMYGYFLGGYIDYYGDYTTVLQYLVENTILLQKLSEMDYYTFTPEEEEALRLECADNIEAGVQEYINIYLSQDTPEERALLEAQARQLYAERESDMLSELYDNAAIDKWYASLQYAPVGDQEVEAEYQTYAAEDELTFKDDVYMYEYYTYMGYKIFYIPAGYRAVLRLMIEVPEAEMEAYTNCRNASEELDQDADEARVNAATEALNTARQALLDSVKEKTDAVYAALAGGESFADVVRRLSEDELAADEEYLQSGIYIHRESILSSPEMVAAAFGQDMTAPGDVSAPYVDEDGVCILYYINDVKEGVPELTAELR